MKRVTRLELEQIRAQGIAAQERLDKIRSSPAHRHADRGLLDVCDPGCPLYEEQSKAWREWDSCATARRGLLRKLEIEQLALAQKQKAAATTGAAGVKRKADRTTERVRASLGDKPERRGIAKKVAAIADISARTASRHLGKLRKR